MKRLMIAGDYKGKWINKFIKKLERIRPTNQTIMKMNT